MTNIQSKNMDAKERGSALLVSLMVIVGLSLLGLGFVALSETESAISMNEKNATQVGAISESAARLVVSWFNSPSWATSKSLMPAYNDTDVNDMKRVRMLDTNHDGTLEDKGRYKEGAGIFCCDKPLKGPIPDRLYGSDTSPDVLINDTTTADGNFLREFNKKLFPYRTVGTNEVFDEGRVTEIRIYAPPMVFPTGVTQPNASGFYDTDPAPSGGAGTRYGAATIAVTAQKRQYNADGTERQVNGAPVILAERTTRIVVSEWPFPGPQGPIQSNANIATGGNVVVHWGKMTADGTMYIKRDLQGLPWLDAHTRAPFQYGYDSCVPWAAGQTYQIGDITCPTDNAIATAHSFVVTVAGGAGTSEPVWQTGEGVNTPSVGSTTVWKERSPVKFPINPSAGVPWKNRYNYLASVLGLQFQDPWVEARARGAITNSAVTSMGPATSYPQPYEWNAPNTVAANAMDSPGLSNWFQMQDHTVEPGKYKEVAFPRIDYQFWKDLALAGKSDPNANVKYLKWVSADVFTDGASNKTFKQWTNVATGANKPGFYFFDTKNGLNPQVPGGSAYLTPAVDVNNAGGGNWQMSGFIYLNSVSFGTQGVQGPDGYYNFPGEPFADEGYFVVDDSPGGTGKLLRDASNNPITESTAIGNRKWDYQDVNHNGHFDIVVAQRTLPRPSGTPTATVTDYVPVPFYDGCTIGTNCSEPHEPYLNIKYPADACCQGGSLPNPLTPGWYNPAAAISTTNFPKEKLDPVAGTMPDCTGADGTVYQTDGKGVKPGGSLKYCTSNMFDNYGPLDLWSGAGEAPILNGVFYNEGTFDSQGNARYFGSVLIKGSVNSTGTNEVWFDERLVKEAWPPEDWPFPRVFITAVQTDRQ